MNTEGLKILCQKKGYRFKSFIGRGGMSIVWLAEGSDGKEVIVKIPNETKESQERLKFESSLLRMLNHEHVVRYIDSFEDYGLPVLVMEYAKGINIEQAASGVPLEEKEALARAIEILLAIDYMHSMSVIHRDIKPKNIIIGDDKTYLKVIDFGTATYLHYTGISYAVISPGGYTPPEQYRFMASPQGDIWSAGATLYFMLTGQHPALSMPGYPNKYCPPPDPRKMKKDVSEETARIIAKAMQWDPSERFSNALEMIMAIEKMEIEPKRETLPTLEIFGRKIPIETSRVIFGRYPQEDSIGTIVEMRGGLIEAINNRIKVVKEGDITYIYVRDPYRWVSRNHFEIYEEDGKWYIRDLGSLNRTAIYYKGDLREVWIGYKRISPPVELRRGSIIYVAYGSLLNIGNQAYAVITFK
ncbi:MAG: FHA domain-containing serine/threonine-protein kinase [Ignisphaera sp.]